SSDVCSSDLDRLSGMNGVGQLSFNLLERTLTLQHSPEALEPALQAIRRLGFTPLPVTEPEPAAPPRRWLYARLALAGLLALAAELLHFTAAAADWTVAALALLSVLLCGLGTYARGWIALRQLDLNINALMSIAVTGALLIEARSLDRARNAIRGLLEMTPETALVQQADGSWQSLPLKEVPLDSRVRVRPGERIGLDGEVLAGQSAVDQSPITGESLPVDKQPGDRVFAGSINQHSE